MTRKSSMKPISLDEEEEEEDDALTAEEAQMRAAQLQIELEEQNKFDCLCDGVNSAISLVDSAFNGLLELKDELIMHGLPPSLLASIILTTGKLYRSITDLHTPVRELTRLVNVYSVPWEQKSEQLKKLHNDYETKQRQLNIAIRKLQLVDTASRRMEREKIVNNWEKVFAKVSSAKTHGRRWKFMIEAFKKKVKEGFIISDLEVDDDSDDDDDYAQSEEEEDEQDESAVDKQTFMLSAITASPPQEEDSGSQPQESELGSDADGIPSEVTESSGNAEDMSPDLHRKPKRQGVSFGPVDEVVEKIVIKPEMKDASVWTSEPEYETRLVVRVYRPLEMKDDENQDLSCNLTLDNITMKTGVLPLPSSLDAEITEKNDTLPPIDEIEIGEVPMKPKPKAGRRKSIGFANRPTSPPVPSSLAKSKSTKPSSILKKLRSPSDADESKDENTENPPIDKDAYKEISFAYPKLYFTNDSMKVAILQGKKSNMISITMLPLSEIDIENLPVKIERDEIPWNKLEENKELPENNEENPEETQYEENVDNDDIEPIFVDLQGIKLGLGGHSHSHIGKLPLVFYFVKKEIKKYQNKESSTESIKELVKDVVGIDIDEISKDELIQILSREYHDVCTSAMSFASSASHKSGYIASEELEAIQEQHDKELRGLQAEYEIKLQQLLSEMEQMQHIPTRTPVQIAVTNDQQAVAKEIAMLHENQISIEEELQYLPEKVPMARRPKQPALPDWGAHLPKNVWVRMKMLTEEMIEKRQQLEARVRRQIAGNIEKKLASQYKLQRANNTIHGPLQDVSLPAVFMPSRTGNVYNPRAHMYFHPAGTAGDMRLCQPPSIFQLPPLPEKTRLSVVNLFDLSKNFQQHTSTDWLTRVASAANTKGSRATTASKRISRLATPNTLAPTANIPAFDV